MKRMTSSEIRNMFLKFFEEKNHLIVPSASLIPVNDPTLLWINAGIAPFKKYFDGSAVPQNRRMTSCQKCMRTTDIESVGDDIHQTFFEMLGNFSIGDYFKEDAIKFSYELLTDEKYLGIDKEKLYVTIYPTDEESYKLWVDVGIDESHIIRLEDNFWEIGEGPCGPDSEIFYDRGEEYDPDHKGISLLRDGIDNERYVEIWNNVFSQYNSKKGMSRNEYPELPSKNIDTGMGLERITCVMQEKRASYDTDLFAPIIEQIGKMVGKSYNNSREFRIIADHVRTLTFAISDGATFSNEGRGYVLRRLLRRAVRYGKKLGVTNSFMHLLVDTVVETMKEPYPMLVEKSSSIKDLILKEEELFQKTLTSGEKRLQELMENSSSKEISGEEVFKLYDTYGFPFELTLEYLEEKGFTVSQSEYNKCMEKQKEMARNARRNENSMNIQNEKLLKFEEESEFVGYDTCESESKIIALMRDNEFVDELQGEGYVILDKTPFYAEMGGQVADTGVISGEGFEFNVIDVIKAPHKQHLHYGTVDKIIKVGDIVSAKIDASRREDIIKNHSATHLLQEALKEALNSEITQAGSKVDQMGLRFDFTYQGKITDQEMMLVEKLVNDKISTKANTEIKITTLDEAKKMGAVAVFEEKYEDTVRVVTLFDSIELCGGTHVKNLGDINKFAIKSFESKGSNVYRVEATTDKYIESELCSVISPYNEEMMKLLNKAKRIIGEAAIEGISLNFDVHINNDAPKSYADIVYNRFEVANVREKVKELEKAYGMAKEQKALEDLSSFDKDIVEGNIKYIVTKTEGYEVSFLKQLVDRLLEKIGEGFVFIANINDGNVNFIAKAHNSLADKIDCGAIIKDASTKSSGNGGGSKTFGQGGGTEASKVDEILNEIEQKI